MSNRLKALALKRLRAAELTRDMDTKHLKQLASIAAEVEFPAGAVIYFKGDRGQSLYLIEEGEVVIETEVPDLGQVAMNRLGPGQFFGWSALFPAEYKMAWTRTTKPTRVIALNADELRRLYQTHPDLEYAIIRRAGQDMITRLKDVRRQLSDLIMMV